MPIIVIANTKGGVGKTTFTKNLADELKPDAVFDQDLHNGLRVLNMMRDVPALYPLEHYHTADTMLNALADYAKDGKSVIVDCGGFDSDITRAAIAVADLVICPCNDTPTDRAGLAHFDMALADISHNVRRHITAHLLVCKAHPSRKHFEKLDRDLEQAQHLTRMQSVIANRPDHYNSHEIGLGVTERTATRHSEAGREVLAVAEEIRALLAKNA